MRLVVTTFLFATFAFICAATLPAAARAEGIKIINKDGTVTNFEIPKDFRPGVTRPLHGKIEAVKKNPAQEPPAIPAEQAKAETRPEAPVQTPVAAQTETSKQEPAEQKAAKPAEEKKEPVKEKPLAQAASGKTPPRPGHKPAMMAQAPAAPAEPYVAPAPATAIAGSVIGKNRAVAIALDHAPPASDYTVVGKMAGDRRVYAVIFKTENGPREIMVDAQSGDVIR